MKRIGLILIALLIMAFPLFSQYVSIPDSAFLYALIDEGVDTNEDNLISNSEAEAVHTLILVHNGISDMTGIEAFVNLDTMIIRGCEFWWREYGEPCSNREEHHLSKLDLSNNTNLKYLECQENQNLIQLNVSNCSVMEYLDCWGNSLTTLDLSNNNELKYLDCGGNYLSSLDISNTDLETLRCSGNQLTDLDLSNNLNLESLNCSGNFLSSLDFSGNSVLRFLNCDDNPLSSLDISYNIALEEIKTRDIPELHEVCVWTMPFPAMGVKIDTSESPNVYYTTECQYVKNVFIPDTAFLNALIEMGLDKNGDSLISHAEADSIHFLDISDREISDLMGVEAFNNLDSLYCQSNNLANINIFKNTSLIYLDVSNNKLSSLKTDRNSVLIFLDCSFNNITELDVDRNNKLQYLDCSYNQLVNLNLSGCQVLEWIDLSHMHTLFEVCVWSLPFPLFGTLVDTTSSIHSYFTSLCEIDGDYLEENDDGNGAYILIDQSYEDLFVSADDDDWYTFSVDHHFSPDQMMTIVCDFIHTEGDINIDLWEAEGEEIDRWHIHTILLSSSGSESDNERIEFPVHPKVYMLHVHLDSGNINTYALRVLLPDHPSVFILPDTLLFEKANIYTTQFMDLEVINQGTQNLIIDSIRTDLIGSKVTPFSAVIEPNESEIFDVTMIPRTMNTVHGDLTLYTNNSDYKQVMIPTSVEGYPSHHFVILKEIQDSMNMGNQKIHRFLFPNNSSTHELRLYPTIQTYFPVNEINDLSLQPDRITGSWVTTSLLDTTQIPPGGNTSFWITLNGENLERGDYYADIILDWYNPISWRGYIPIQLHVMDTVQTIIRDPDISHLRIYPNPATDVVNIQNTMPGGYAIEIISLNGSIIQNITASESHHQIDFSSFQKGVYLITIRSVDFVTTRKIIKL